MEATSNFAEALEIARFELDAEGRLTTRQDRLVRRILANPQLRLPTGQRENALVRVHHRVRKLYQRLEKLTLTYDLDWTALVEWIKEHWDEILRFILMVIPFLI